MPPTPRKAPLMIRECRYQGIPRYEIATQFLDRKDAEEIVYRVTMFEELVEALKTFGEHKHWCKRDANLTPCSCGLDKCLARASQGGSDD